jgi:hypothetical protein
MPNVGFHYNVHLNQSKLRLFWGTFSVKLAVGVEKAAKLYASRLWRELTKVQGSRPIGPGLRLRFKHSSPGEPPYTQTFNLARSIKVSSNVTNKGAVRKTLTRFKARISTSVPYAPILEYGGSGNFPQRGKKHTPWRLINPLKGSPFILPRPVWYPVFVNNQAEMERIIRHEASKAS